ncbi:hypothetical protein [Rhodoluna limnophila]|uniref:hypothetical protein n=1 Tax=Rhodoluna limnophila TaxID=232537 RepID=UPI001106713B|nr:hypothetical protein [Rhodoluna limnophila]
MKLSIFSAAAGAAMVGALVLTGCASGPVASPSPSASASVSASTTPVDSRGADALAEFEVAATASCDRAMAEGVVETVAAGGKLAQPEWWLLMVPKANAIDGFSAARYSSATDSAEVIYETYEFDTCYFATQFALAKEGNVDINKVMHITYDKMMRSYVAVGLQGEGGAAVTFFFVSDDGFIEKVQYPGAEVGEIAFERAIRYGALTAEEQGWFESAVAKVN